MDLRVILSQLNKAINDPELSLATRTTVGFTKGVLAYIVPIALMRRKIDLRRCLAIGFFMGSANFVEQIVQNNHFENEVREKLSILGNFVSVLISCLIDGDIYRSRVFVIWCCIRALRDFLPTIQYAPTAIMCFSSSVIISTYLSVPEDMNKAYFRFLERQGSFVSPEGIKRLRNGELYSTCEAFHPDYGYTAGACMDFVKDFWLNNLSICMKVYIPVHFLSFLFSGKKNVFHLIENIIRSTLFLSLYSTFCVAGGCAFYRLHSFKANRLSIFLYAWVGGLPTLIERSGRRAELAAYSFTYAFDSILGHIMNKCNIPSGTGKFDLWKLAFLAISTTSLLHHDNYPSFLKWFFNKK